MTKDAEDYWFEAMQEKFEAEKQKSELIATLANAFERQSGELSAMRTDMHAELATMRSEMGTEFASIRMEMQTEMASQRELLMRIGVTLVVSLSTLMLAIGAFLAAQQV